MIWDEFVAIPNGYRVFNNGFDQCVALANLYHEGVLGGQFVPVGSAYQWWTQYQQLGMLRDKYTQVSVSEAPRAGDIFVARFGAYDAPNGHIGIVIRDWDGSTFGTKEQNAENNRYTWQTYNRNKDNVLGFLRPKQSPLPHPITEEDIEEMFIANVKGSWYIIIPQGSGKPIAAVLGGDSNAASAGIPVLQFNWQPSIDALKRAVEGIA
jgi:hypothetical protein